MAEQTFKAPNFYEREIDLSAPSTTGLVGVPAAVIGTSNKGLAFVPTTVANFDEFTKVFGGLDTNQLGPYAVKEFLKHRSALTYVRVLGAGSNYTDSDLVNTLGYGYVRNAGFKLPGVNPAVSGDARHTGLVQFLAATHTLEANGEFGMPMFTDNDTVDNQSTVNLIRGLIMTPSTSRVMILSSSTTTSTFNSSTFDDTLADESGKFKIVISSSLGSTFSTQDGAPGIKILLASLDPSSKDYFAKILNRDPEKFVQEQHYLHGDFAVDTNIASVRNASSIAILSGSSNTTSLGENKTFREVFGRYDARYQAPQTTYFISQPFGNAEYDLFKFESLDDGEYANSLYKISISNIKVSIDPANKYGTFNIQIRDWNDKDSAPIIIEQFTNCSLNPNSQNYVAKLVGDKKVYYNFDVENSSEKRLVTVGKYENASRHVRIVMNDDVETGNVPDQALPFGFRGLEMLNVNPVTKSTSVLPSNLSRLNGKLVTTSITSSFMPPIPYRFKVTRGEISTTQSFVGEPSTKEFAYASYYWGVKFERSSTSSTPTDTSILNANAVEEKNTFLESLTRFVGIKKMDALVTGSAADDLNNNKFSLSKVVLYNSSLAHLTSSVNNHMKEAAYIRNARINSTDYKWTDPTIGSRITFSTLLSLGTPSTFNKFSVYAKFTNFMYGGFDGTNFLDKNARRMNDKSVSFDSGGGAEVTSVAGFTGLTPSNPSGLNVYNSGVASYLKAADISTDTLAANNNLLIIPGIKEPYITDQVMNKVRDYGLSMYVMDIPSYDDDGNRLYDDSIAKPNISQTANNFDSRSIDNNYVAVYYPDVFIDDTTNQRKVKTPASVAAIGALAFNDRVSYPWFAPAGFNRAALDFVNNVSVRLNSVDKDRLYESRINPIATFPRLGYVIYGQKTLQINKSALDRVNVRRLMLEIKRIIIDIAQRIVFEQNTPAVRNKFVADASFQFSLIQAQAGVEAFQVVMNESNNSQADVDLNRLNGRIVVVPTRVVEYIAIDFIVTNSGVQFV